MGLERRGKNSWRIAIDLGKDENGDRKRHTETVRGKKADAERRKRELLTALDRGAPINTSNLAVGEYLDDWLKRKAPRVSYKTMEDYEGIVSRHLKPKLGNIPLSKLAPRHIEGLHNQMENEGLSPRTIQYVHRVLSQALKHAMKLEMLARNVCDVVDLPKMKRKETRVMNASEIKTFLEVTKESLYWPIFNLAVQTGLRRGELLGLRWQDVNLPNETISVNQTVIRLVGKGVVIGDPKTDSSRRIVKLTPSSTRLLIGMKLKRKDEIESIGREWDESALVFCKVGGEPFSPDTVSHNFGKALKKAGLPHMRFHDLRHTHATLLMEQGTHPKTVSDRLGHSTIAITLDTYSHVSPSMQEQAAQAFEAAIG